MQDPFIQVADDFDDDALMMRATDTPMPPTSSKTAIDGSSSAGQRGAGNFADVANRKIVCPFCGAINDAVPEEGKGITCPRCTMQDSPATRQATKSRIGPWFVRQNRNPSAPGMRFETLLILVNRGQVTATSIVRGPTTHQLWRFAAQVKGLSREFGLCYSCGASIDRTASLCPHCNRLQEPPVNPDVLLETSAASTPAGARPPAQPSASSASSQPRSRKPAAPPAEKPLPPAPARSATPAAPARPPQRRGDEILTARELAAAFQLDFAPAGNAAAETAIPRQWGRKLLGIVVVMALMALLVGLIVRRDWRDGAASWTRQAYASVKEAVESASSDSAKDDAQDQAVQASDEQAGQPDNPGASPAPMLADVRTPLDAAGERSARTDAADNAATAASARDDRAAARQMTSQSPRPTPQAPQSAPAQTTSPLPAPIAPVADAGTRSSITSPDAPLPYDQARALWRKAIDLEAKQDFAGAIRLYEQIKQLPREVWPPGLEVYLELAKKRVKQ